MNEENENEVIKNYDDKEKNDNTLLKRILTIILTLIFLELIMFTSFLFIVHIILWLILRKKANKDNIFWKAYNSAIELIGILIFVVLIAFGGCFVVLLGGGF